MRFRREPLFLARQSYRRRRLEDAAKLLPILGAILFLLPLLMTGAGTARQGLFLFGAWFGLILATALISFGLRGWQDVGRTSKDKVSNAKNGSETSHEGHE